MRIFILFVDLQLCKIAHCPSAFLVRNPLAAVLFATVCFLATPQCSPATKGLSVTDASLPDHSVSHANSQSCQVHCSVQPCCAPNIPEHAPQLCREQSERFNVWLALLALENKYADEPSTAAAALLQRALQHTDKKKMYLAAIDVFAQDEARADLLLTCVKGVRRKFGHSCKVWLRLYELDVLAGRDPGGTQERATQALDKRKHVKLLSRAALLECKRGSPDRGRALFEGLLQSYPKRTDLWGLYLDQEIKLGDAASTRNVFERTIHLALPAKKMKFFFKRYLEFEEAHGTAATVAHVKQCALDYVNA